MQRRGAPIPYVLASGERTGPMRVIGRSGLGFGDAGDLSMDLPDFTASYDPGASAGFDTGTGTTVDELVVTASPATTTATSSDILDPLTNPIVSAGQSFAYDLSTAIPSFAPNSPNPLATLANAVKKALAGLKVSASAGGGSGGAAARPVQKPASLAGAKANPEIMWLAAGAGLLVLTVAMTRRHAHGGE